MIEVNQHQLPSLYLLFFALPLKKSKRWWIAFPQILVSNEHTNCIYEDIRKRVYVCLVTKHDAEVLVEKGKQYIHLVGLVEGEDSNSDQGVHNPSKCSPRAKVNEGPEIDKLVV